MVQAFFLAIAILLAFPILAGYAYFWVGATVALARALIRGF